MSGGGQWGQACVVHGVECQGEVIGIRHVWFMVLSVRERSVGSGMCSSWLLFRFRSSTGRNKLSTHVQWKGPDRRLPLIDDLRRTSSDSFIYNVS